MGMKKFKNNIFSLKTDQMLARKEGLSSKLWMEEIFLSSIVHIDG